MSIFTEAVVDNFNRGGPGIGTTAIGSNYAPYSTFSGVFTPAAFTIGQTSSGFADQMMLGSPSNSNLIYNHRYSPLSALLNTEMYMTLASFPTGGASGSNFWMLSRIQNPGGTSARALAVVMSLSGGGATQSVGIQFWELTNFTNARTIANQGGGLFNIAFGDTVGMRVYESPELPVTVYEFWTKLAAESNQWSRKYKTFDYNPNRIVTSGPSGHVAQINITGQQITFDNFGVGEMPAIPAHSIDSDVFPGYTAGLLQKSIEAKDANLAITSGYVVNKTVLSQPLLLMPRIIKPDHLYSSPALIAKPDRDISRFVFPMFAQFPYAPSRISGGSVGGGISIY